MTLLQPIDPEDILNTTRVQLKVIDYRGPNKQNPDSGKTYSQTFHWYDLLCTCGAVVVMYRKQFFTRDCCDSCSDVRRGKKAGTIYRQWDAIAVPDFLRLPVPESITTRPETY